MRTEPDRDELFGMDESLKLALGVIAGCVLFLGVIMLALSVESITVRLGLLLGIIPALGLPVVLVKRSTGHGAARPRRRFRDSTHKPLWLLTALFAAAGIWFLYFFGGSTGARCGMGSLLYTAAWMAGIVAYSRDGDPASG